MQCFDIHSGVRQGGIISPTLFIFFINDLVTHLKCLDLSIDVKDEKFCILLYTDDIVLLANKERECVINGT